MYDFIPFEDKSIGSELTEFYDGACEFKDGYGYTFFSKRSEYVEPTEVFFYKKELKHMLKAIKEYK